MREQFSMPFAKVADASEAAFGLSGRERGASLTRKIVGEYYLSFISLLVNVTRNADGHAYWRLRVKATGWARLIGPSHLRLPWWAHPLDRLAQ